MYLGVNERKRHWQNELSIFCKAKVSVYPNQCCFIFVAVYFSQYKNRLYVPLAFLRVRKWILCYPPWKPFYSHFILILLNRQTHLSSRYLQRIHVLWAPFGHKVHGCIGQKLLADENVIFLRTVMWSTTNNGLRQKMVQKLESPMYYRWSNKY